MLGGIPSSVSNHIRERNEKSVTRFQPTPCPTKNWMGPRKQAFQHPETPVADDDGSADESTWKMIRKNISEEKWKVLLEELYKDKQYFDRVQGKIFTDHNHFCNLPAL